MAVMVDTIPKVSIDGLDMSDYVVMDVSMHKELLKPVDMRFSMRKRKLGRDSEDLNFNVAKELIGKSVTLEIKTIRKDENGEKQNDTLSFKGIIFGARMQRPQTNQATYIAVTAYSQDYLLADNQHCCSFENSTLSDIIKSSVSAYGEDFLEVSPSMNEAIPYVVQYNETTYQFIARLAQRYGEFMYYENGKLHFGKLPNNESKELYPDIDLLGIQYDLAVEHTPFSHAAHDYLKDENLSTDGLNAGKENVGQLPESVMSKAGEIYKKATIQNYHSATTEDSRFDQLELSTKVQAWGDKSRYLTCKLHTNRADLLMGDQLVLKESVDNGGSSGDDNIKKHKQEFVVIGIDYHATADGHFENEVTAIPAGVPYAPYMGCDIYPQCESQRARVVDNNDPEQLGRIRVQFLWQELAKEDSRSPWLRITQPHGGDDKGFYFVPEIDEEVMVAFENGNAEKPYVVGTLYHGKQKPGSQWPDSNNNVKAIRTRNGHTVEIHDEGEGGYIRIYDYQKENYILTYSTDEKLIKLESTGNIELYAQNDIIMHAENDMKIEIGNNRNVEVGGDETVNIGKSQSVKVGEDKKEDVGNDRTDTVARSYAQSVGENSDIEIGGNSKTVVADKHTLKADNILQVSEHKTQMYSDTTEQKADSSLKIDGGSGVDIHGENIRIS